MSPAGRVGGLPRRGAGPTGAVSRGARAIAIAGWLLFVVSALLYIAASLRAGDMLALGGSVFFLLACIVFLIPLLRR